jgi:Trypsin-like peptidase domain/NACHT domain
VGTVKPVKEGRAALAEALRAATLMVSAPGRIGTGFFVTPGQVLTCAHVVAEPDREPPEHVVGQWGDIGLELDVMPEVFLREHDLALLRVIGELDHPVACLATQIEPGDELWAYGHPGGDYRLGDVIRLVYDGPSVGEDGVELLRVTEGRAVKGFSGGPVLSWRTGGVCGVLRRADAPPGGPPGARLIGAARIFEAFPHLKPPSVLTPDRLPWFQLLNDKQLAAGRWCYPGPKLRTYLEAARITARTHPYRLALPNAPQLSTVYLRQQATRVVRSKEAWEDEAREDRDDLAAKARPVHADLVLEGDQRCVFVVGGPGTGKSSLLRHLAQTTADRWLDDVGGTGVPILVSAGALAGDRPLAEALAEGVTAALGARLADRRLADMFEDEPLPGVPWMILVDGVDEVLDPERRSRVLETVVFWRSKPSPYRFLVTSRPLPQGQLDVLSENVIPLYEIEPFSPDQLPEFAGRWFSALGMPDPDALVDAFLDRLAGSQLSRLAEIPLIATMLCVVFANQDGQRLPPSRVSLYEDFVSLLLAKRHTQTNALERLQQRIRPYGMAAEQAVDQLLADLRPLLEHLANQRLRTRNPGTLVELAVMQAGDLRPAHLPAEQWRDLVEEALRLSGLVVERSGQLAFFHYTIEEYLAVCAREIPAAILSEVLEEVKQGRSSLSLLRTGVLVSRSPDQAREVAIALSHQGLKGLTFLAALVYDGVQFPDDVVTAARDTLEAFAAAPDGEWSSERYDATEALTLIDPDLGFRFWEQFANDNDLDDVSRVEAIHRLVRTRPRSAAAVLEPVAMKWETPLGIRQTIVYELTVVNRQRSRELLIKMAMSTHIDGVAARWAVTTLCNQVDQPSQVELLAAIVSGSDLPGSYRLWAATRLFEQDRLGGIAAMSTVAQDRTVRGPDRLWAVEVMISYNWGDGRLWHPKAYDLFATIALDPVVEAPSRIEAARELMNQDPQRARAALTIIAADRYVDGADRAHAAAALADLDLPRAVTALVTIAADPASGSDGRLEAALALAWISRSRAANALLAIAADRRVDGDYRATAAHQLDWTDRRALPFALTIIAYDTQIDGTHRTRAALRLSKVSPEPGRLALETLVTDLAVSGPDRLQAACRLASLKSDKASAALTSLSAERDLSDAHRLHAALEGGGSDPLAALAADTHLDGMHRVRAAFELAAVDRSRGIDALASLSQDPSVDNVREELARAETLRVHRERIKYFRESYSDRVTEDAPEADLGRIPSYRVQAARLLDHYDHAAAIDRLTTLANSPDGGIAEQAAAALAAVVGPS